MFDQPEYQESVAKALDKAIAKVAKTESSRLIELEGDKIKTARAIETALQGLKDLRDGEIPCYDDKWLVLLYSTWYQPSHMNLAYSMIKKMANRRDPEKALLTRNGKLHVVDFGCGTLAMQFGVALAAADALHHGQTLTSIKIDLIDSSQLMIDLGLKIWRQFKNEVKDNDRLTKLSEACDLICNETLTAMEVPAFYSGYSRWMSTMHVVYEDNREDVKKELYRLSNAMDPHVGLITCYYTSKFLAKSVSPFENERYQLSPSDVQLQFKVNPLQGSDLALLNVYSFRCDLYYQKDQHVKNEPFVQSFLCGNRHVPWDRAGADFLIYTRC